MTPLPFALSLLLLAPVAVQAMPGGSARPGHFPTAGRDVPRPLVVPSFPPYYTTTPAAPGRDHDDVVDDEETSAGGGP
jgi:hypothetical protein